MGKHGPWPEKPEKIAAELIKWEAVWRRRGYYPWREEIGIAQNVYSWFIKSTAILAKEYLALYKKHAQLQANVNRALGFLRNTENLPKL